MKTLRIGIVGAGIMADWHARVYRTLPGCRVAAVCDPDRERAAAFAEKFGVRKLFATHREMLAGAELDMVSICTPDFAHAEPAVDCLKAGKHALIEKPLAVTVKDAEAIIAAARRGKVKAMAQFSHRWIPAYRQTKERAAGGALGRPVMAYARKNDRIYVPTKMLSWAARTTPAWFLSSHDMDLVCWFFEVEPVEVYATAVTGVLTGMGINTPDAIHAQVRFANGAVATFESCWIYPDTFPSMTDSYLEVVFTAGVVHLDRRNEQVEVTTPERSDWPRILLGHEYEEGEFQGAVPMCVRHFVRCVMQDREPAVTLQSSLRVTKILEAVQRSIETGRAARITG